MVFTVLLYIHCISFVMRRPYKGPLWPVPVARGPSKTQVLV